MKQTKMSYLIPCWKKGVPHGIQIDKDGKPKFKLSPSSSSTDSKYTLSAFSTNLFSGIIYITFIACIIIKIVITHMTYMPYVLNLRNTLFSSLLIRQYTKM